jgi:hypothetical protein
MATTAQIAANHRNARKSTGPRTAAGKAASSRNALRHRLTARRAVALDEDAGDFERFRAGMRTELAPRDGREVWLAETMSQAAWRLRRAARSEAALFNRVGSWDEAFSDDGRELAALARYEMAADRAFYRALALLERGRAGSSITSIRIAKTPRRQEARRCQKNDSAKRTQFSGAAPPRRSRRRSKLRNEAKLARAISGMSSLAFRNKAKFLAGVPEKSPEAPGKFPKLRRQTAAAAGAVRAAGTSASPPAAGRAAGRGRWRRGGRSSSRPCRAR